MNRHISLLGCLVAMSLLSGLNLCHAEQDVYLPGEQSPCAKAEVWASIGLKFSPDKSWDCTVAAPDPGYEAFGPQVDGQRSIVTTCVAEQKATARIGRIRVDGKSGHYWFVITDGDLLLPDRCLGTKVFHAPKHPWRVSPQSKAIEIQTVLEESGSDTETLTTCSSYQVEPGPVKDSVHVFVDGRKNQCVELLPSMVGGSQALVLMLGLPGATFGGATQGPINLPGLGRKQAIAKCTIALTVDKKALLYELGEAHALSGGSGIQSGGAGGDSRQAAEQLDWETTKAKNSAEAYYDFLAKHATTAHVNDAISALLQVDGDLKEKLPEWIKKGDPKAEQIGARHTLRGVLSLAGYKFIGGDPPIFIEIGRDRLLYFSGRGIVFGGDGTRVAVGIDPDPERTRVPEVSITTEVGFSFQEMVTLLGRATPTQPNRWLITARLLNEGSKSVEVRPVYLFSEGHRVEGRVLENARMICPKSYKDAMDPKSLLAVTVAPSDESQMVTESVAMPLSQSDEPPQAQIGAYISSQQFKASLVIDGKPTRWEKMDLSPQSKLDCSWEFWSPWAAPEKVRTGKAFRVVHLGPVVSCRTDAGSKAYLAVATLELAANSGGKSWNQASLQWKELTPNLGQDFVTSMPECPSAAVFAEAIVRTLLNSLNTTGTGLRSTDTKALQTLQSIGEEYKDFKEVDASAVSAPPDSIAPRVVGGLRYFTKYSSGKVGAVKLSEQEAEKAKAILDRHVTQVFQTRTNVSSPWQVLVKCNPSTGAKMGGGAVWRGIPAVESDEDLKGGGISLGYGGSVQPLVTGCVFVLNMKEKLLLFQKDVDSPGWDMDSALRGFVESIDREYSAWANAASKATPTPTGKTAPAIPTPKDTTSQLQLGSQYAKGEGRAKDLVEAYKWLHVAAERGNTEAVWLRFDVSRGMTQDQIKTAQALATEMLNSTAPDDAQVPPSPSLAETMPPSPPRNSPAPIPDLRDGKLQFKDYVWFRELVTPPGEQFGYFSNKKLQFDEEASVVQFGSQRSRIHHSGDALKLVDPVTVTLGTDDPLNYVNNVKTTVPPSGTVVWIEPTKDHSKLVLTTDSSRITPEALRVLGKDRSDLPDFKLEFHIEPQGVIYLLGDGTQYWGATEGIVTIGGKPYRNLKGLRIVNGAPSDEGNNVSSLNAPQASETSAQAGVASADA